MRLCYLPSDSLFVALTRYDEREIPKLAGFKWNPAARRWETTDPRRAHNLRRYADRAALDAIDEGFNGGRLRVAASRAEVAPIEVPAPAGLAFLAYQKTGVAYMNSLDCSLNADEMGLGKTVQALGVVNVMAEPKRVLVVCPASLRLNWRDEAKRWLTHKMAVAIVTDTWYSGIRPSDPLAAALLMVIVSYRGAVSHREKIEQVEWDAVIVDECHMLVNTQTQQSLAVLGGRRKVEGHFVQHPPIKAGKMMFLTGTPIVNRPRELWPIVHRCDRQGLGGDWPLFKARYIETDQFLTELHDYLRSSFMVRRLKADVLAELPSKRRQIMMVEPEGMYRILEEESVLLSRKARELAQLRHDHAVQALNQWRGSTLMEIAAVRHKTAVKKIPSVIEHVFNTLDQEAKAVVFCHHHDVVDGLAAGLGAAATVFDGRVSVAERDARIKRFQTDPGCRVFIGSIRAAGLGLTLTAASTVIFAELDWTPAAMVQAEDRLHRIGQKSSVLVQHLVIDGSIDQRMAEILIEKAKMMDMILDGKMPEAANDSILDDLLKRPR